MPVTDTVFLDTATLTSELDTDTTWARDLPMPKLNLKLKPMPNPDTMLAVPSTVIPVTDTVMVTTITARGLLRPMLNLMDTMDMDMVMEDTDTDTITAKDPLNLTMDTDLVLLSIP